MKKFTRLLLLTLVGVIIYSSAVLAQSKAKLQDMGNSSQAILIPDESNAQQKALKIQKFKMENGVENVSSPLQTASGDKVMSAGVAPQKFFTGPVVNPNASPKGSTAWAYGFFGSGFISLDVSTPGTYLTSVPSAPWASYAGAYDNLSPYYYYILSNSDGYLYMINVSDGSILKKVGLPDFSAGSPGASPTGMACDRNTGIMYVMCYGSTSDLFTIDVNDASTTYVGSATSGLLMIDIAIDGAGVLYGHSLSDEIYTIDKGTGASTLLGATGFDANYAQGMGYDPLGDVVYLAAYNNTSSQGELRSVNTTTGATTLIGAFVGGEEVDAFSFPTPSANPTHDVFAGIVTNPVSGENTSTEIVTVTIFNMGTVSESNVPVYYSFEGGSAVNEVAPGPIPAGGSYSYSFTTTIDASGVGTHDILVCTDLSTDDIPGNDCVNHFFETVPACVPITAYPYTYNFDDSKAGDNLTDACTPDGSVPLNLLSCWQNFVGPDEDIDWNVITGATPSSGTGPTGDHTSGSGQYLFTEASACYSSLGTILSPEFDFTSLTNPELEFWYHMYGLDMGTMSVDISIDDGASWTNIWTLSGDQGNVWNQVILDLVAYTSESSVYLRWQGLTGLNYASDMALDDVTLREQPGCPLPLTPMVDNILNNQADLSWIDNIGTMWDVEIIEATDPLTGVPTDEDLSATTFNATGLKQLTEYHWQVRSDCGGGLVSDWVQGPNFTTLNNGDCVWSICLRDDWGDGWNGGSIDVYVGTTLVYDDLTLASGAGPECYDFMVTNTSLVDITFTGVDYPEECMYFVYGNYGTLEFVDGTNYEIPSGVVDLPTSCDAPPVPANDLCTTPEPISGPYPVTVNGTTKGATSDACTSNPVVFYEVDLPYAFNYVTVDFCPTSDDLGTPIWSVWAALLTDCACNGYSNTYLDWYGCYYEYAPYYEFYGIPGPGTILLPVSIGDINTSALNTRQMDFQFDIDIYEVFQADLKVFLEGPYDTPSDLMLSTLNTNGYLPLTQPFNPTLPYYGNGSPKWLYAGTESVASIPSTDIVDWILVQIRDAATAPDASSATIVGNYPAFVLYDGTVVARDGVSFVTFPALKLANDPYIVVYQRNHLGILSSGPAVFNGVSGAYEFDFSSGETQVYGGANGHKELEPGVWGMIAADGDANGLIQSTDETGAWKTDLGSSGYLGGDFDMNGLGQSTDETGYWVPNLGGGGQVPAKGADNSFINQNSGYQSQIPD